MEMCRNMRLSTLAIVLVGAANLTAQVTTGALNGLVMDTNGKPIPGARVTLESPALFQSRVLITDSKGEYRALLLPVGNYTVKVSAKDYLGRTNADVRVGVGSNLNLNFNLRATAVESATVEVVSTLAQQSKADDKVSANYSAEELLRLPVSRGFSGALGLTPGITGGSGVNAMIRGSESNQINYSIDGIAVKDDRGNSDNNLTGSATIYQPLEDSVEDVQVVLSALNARYGRSSGGFVNVATKSGSNTFEGTLRAYMSRESWHADNALDNAYNNHYAASQDYSRHMEATLSGPILKDRLWFYVGARFEPSSSSTHMIGYQIRPTNGDGSPTNAAELSKYVTTTLTTYGKYPGVDAALQAGPGGNYSVKNSFADYGQHFDADTKFDKVEGKLTGMVNDSNFVTATFLKSKTSQGGYSTEGNPSWLALKKDAIGNLVTKVEGYSLGWNSNISASTTLEARLAGSMSEVQQPHYQEPGYNNGSVLGYFSSGSMTSTWTGRSPGPTTRKVAWYGVATNAVASSSPTPTREGNRTFTTNLKTFVDWHGTHELDFGAELYKSVSVMGHNRNGGRGVWDGWYTDPSQAAGSEYLYPVYYTADGSAVGPRPNDHNYRRQEVRGPGGIIEVFGVTSADADNVSNALWVNDVYTINNQWNVLFGVRANKLRINDVTGKSLCSSTMVEPRLQVKWNPDGVGHQIFTVSAAKLASAYTDALGEAMRSDEWNVRSVYHWSGLHDSSGNLIQQGLLSTDDAATQASKVKFVTYAQLTDLQNYGNATQYLDQTHLIKADGLRAPYNIETTLGYERNFDIGNFRLNLVQRVYKDDWVFRARTVYGLDGMTLVSDPTGHDKTTKAYEQNKVFLNSKFDRTYQGMEASWNLKVASNVTFGGNLNLSQSVGTDGADYYNYQNLRATLSQADQDASVGSGILSKALVVKGYLTYVIPVGKGNISASILGTYYTGDQASFYDTNEYSNVRQFMNWSNPGGQPFGDSNFNMGNYHVVNGVTYQVVPTDSYGDSWSDVRSLNHADSTVAYRRYYGRMGEYKRGYDVYSFDVKLQAQIPIVGKMVLLASASIYNIFNQNLPTSSLAWKDMLGGSGYGADLFSVWGHPAASQGSDWGVQKDPNYYSGSRAVGELSVGLKF